MNKKIIALSVLSVVFLSACSRQPTVETFPVEEPVETSVIPSSESQLSQLQTAIANGEKMLCNITRTEDGQTIEYYVHGEKFRVNGIKETNSSEVGYLINNGTHIYSWSEPRNEGFNMTLPTKDELQVGHGKYQELMEKVPDFSQTDTVKEYENQGYTMDCQVNQFDDQLLQPPANVKFQDLDQASQQAEQQMQEVMDQLSEEDRQKMQEMMSNF